MVKYGVGPPVPGGNIEQRAPTLRMSNESPPVVGGNCVDCGKPLGRMAVADPAMVREVADAGHTIANHTWSHKNLQSRSARSAGGEIELGISAVKIAAKRPISPFFRFPYFESTQAQLDLLQSRGIVVFGADLWASDWNDMTPEQELKLISERITVAGKGIILFHDAQARTAAMMPAFLRFLRENGFHVVHLVPGASQKNADAH